MMNRVALLTGSAGQLGAEILKNLLHDDFIVYAIDQKIEKSSAPINPKLHEINLDITSEEEVEGLFQRINANGHKLDVVINNAGIGVFTPFRERTKEDFMKVLEVNVFGAFNVIKNSIDFLAAKNNPVNIVNVASIYGVVSSDPGIYEDLSRMNSEVYSASKAGVIQMTKYFSVHLAKYGVCVNAVSPGGIYNNHPAKFNEHYSRKTPLSRMARVEEIASAVMLFCNNRNAYLTGQNLVVDGGFTAW